MKNYDEIVGFNYLDRSEWDDHIEEKIIPLHISASKILKTREFLEKKLDGKEISKIFEENGNFERILLGGITPEGEYKKGSLAKIWRESVGIHINPTQWVSLRREEGIEAEEYIRCNFSETPILEFLNNLRDLTGEIIKNNPNKEKPEEVKTKDLIDDPESIVEEIRKIYENIIQFSANHNYHTFFILTLPNTPRRYLERAYPRLKKNFSDLENLLSLEKEKPIVKDEYSLYSFKEEGLGDNLYRLNERIWEFLENEQIREMFGKFFENVRNLKEKYYETIPTRLEEIGWNMPELISSNKKYFFSNATITHEGRGTEKYFLCNSLESPISLFQLLDELSPGLFLNKCKISISDPFVYEKAEVGGDKKKIKLKIRGK